jgi:hypothetical protein
MSSKVKKLSTTERKIINKCGRFDADKLAKKLKLAMEAFKDLRIERTKFHQLGDILVISVLAVIGGAKGRSHYNDVQTDAWFMIGAKSLFE